MDILVRYDIAKHNKGKPDADISMVTDYDVRYLKIISRIFAKGLPNDSWKGKNDKDLLAFLEGGGKMAAFWYGNVIYGAVCWQWNENKKEGKILQICFKKRLRRFGYGRTLMDYVLYQIISGAAKGESAEGLLYAEINPEDEAAGFFKAYGFELVVDADEATVAGDA